MCGVYSYWWHSVIHYTYTVHCSIQIVMQSALYKQFNHLSKLSPNRVLYFQVGSLSFRSTLLASHDWATHYCTFNVKFCLHGTYFTASVASWADTSIVCHYCHRVCQLSSPPSSNKVCPAVRTRLNIANRGRERTVSESGMKNPPHCVAYTVLTRLHSPHKVFHSPSR